MSTTSTASNFISKINQNFPVGGRDNNTQGFRDNFKNIEWELRVVWESLQWVLILFTAVAEVQPECDYF